MAGHDKVHGLYGDNHTPGNKLDATVAPDADNDVTEGYGVGSWWFDITAGKAYTCLDATEGAAVWVEATAGDVSADANLTDDMIVRGDGGAKGVQTSLIELLDAGMMRVPIGQGVAAKTDDASDDAYTNFCGGGAEGDGRGAHVACFGNEHASGAGKLLLWAGNVVGGTIQMYTEGAVRLRINKDGTVDIPGITTLGDGSKLATNAAPVADVDLVNKKYVDGKASGGVLEKVFIDTYEGNNANSREIDLGDDYDEIHIYLEESLVIGAYHLIEAYAIGATYGIIFEEPAPQNYAQHTSMADSNSYFQGKMFSGDANKIKLGTSGASDQGCNNNGWTYRVIAKKFSSVETF